MKVSVIAIILFRNCSAKLPKPKGAEMPYVEGVIYLLLTGDLPTESNITDVLDEFKKRHIVPNYVYDVIDAFPGGSHPMTIFSTAILTMHRESFFNRKYFSGLNKQDYWEPTYEDAISLLAKLPEIGAYIYSKVIQGRQKDNFRSKSGYGSQFCPDDGYWKTL